MSILIKGMEMPERCGACFLRVGGCKQRIYMEQRPKYCPLIEVPTPHGRLGDLDALKAQYKYGEADSEDERLWMMNIRRAITNAPTVIEAEGETDGR